MKLCIGGQVENSFLVDLWSGSPNEAESSQIVDLSRFGAEKS